MGELQKRFLDSAGVQQVWDSTKQRIATEIDNLSKNIAIAYEKTKFEFSGAPVGTLVDYNDKEIRIMVPKDAVFTKQAVGIGGNPNHYYVTFRTYAPNDAVVGYREYLGTQFDKETLTDLSIDKQGRKYQTTWLSVASYDATIDTWTYFGANSSEKRYIGWDYRIDWYDAQGIIIASDMVRINLSNEECHFTIVPSYVNSAIQETKDYTDEEVAKIQPLTKEEIDSILA